MKCMKCGKDLKTAGVFCPDCQGSMENYPVKPGISIQLPPQTELPIQRRRSRKRAPKPEEQIARLRTTRNILLCALAISLVALLVALVLLLRMGGYADPIGELPFG